jgi:hypothetical protein
VSGAKAVSSIPLAQLPQPPPAAQKQSIEEAIVAAKELADHGSFKEAIVYLKDYDNDRARAQIEQILESVKIQIEAKVLSSQYKKDELEPLRQNPKLNKKLRLQWDKIWDKVFAEKTLR